MLAAQRTPVYIECEILEDFRIKGIWYRAGSRVELLADTAQAMAKAGKVRPLREVPELIQTRRV